MGGAVGWGRLGELRAPPHSLAVFNRPTSKGRGKTGRDRVREREGKGREGRGERERWMEVFDPPKIFDMAPLRIRTSIQMSKIMVLRGWKCTSRSSKVAPIES